jgi:hypothetical protein
MFVKLPIEDFEDVKSKKKVLKKTGLRVSEKITLKSSQKSC